MPYQSHINYNPSLSVSEIAERSGVSESAVRKFIDSRKIDRRYDEQLRRYNSVKQYVQAHKDAKIKEIASALHMAANTIRKYMAMDCPPAKPATDKVSKLNLSKLTASITTVSKDQTAILSGILRLYLNNAPTFDCDLTTSRGYFYNYGIPRPHLLFDKYPQGEDVKPLEQASSLPVCSLKSIVIDLPFMVQSCPTPKSQTSIMLDRFTSFQSIEELHEANKQMLQLAYRLLAPKGILVMKTQDIWKHGKQHWVSLYVIEQAHKLGLELIDQFILVAKTKILREAYTQHCARKMHSYFLVFKKK